MEYELQTIRKSYSDLALREGIQHSLRGAVADVVCNMGPNVPLGHDTQEVHHHIWECQVI